MFLIGSIARNIAHTLPVVKESYNAFKTICPFPVKYVIYENNSTDKTAMLLQEWASKDESVQVHTEQLDYSMFKCRNTHNEPCKYEVIAYARNQLLARLKEVKGTVEKIMIIDMNNENQWPCNAIVDVLKIDNDIYDVMVCNGYDAYGNIVDTFSYRDLKHWFGPEVQTIPPQNRPNFVNHTSNVPVISAFNGLAILQPHIIYESEYCAFPTIELNKIYQNVCDQLIVETHPHVHMKHVGMYMFPDDDIFYYNYKNFNYPIVSPHVTFFAKLHFRKNATIIICPLLQWKWFKSNVITI